MPENIKIPTGLLIVFIGTPLALLGGYGQFGWIGYGPLFFEDFNKWPWFRAAFLAVVIVFLTAHVLPDDFMGEQKKNDYKWMLAALIASVASSIVFLLFYPSGDSFDMYSSGPDFGVSIFLETVVMTIGLKWVTDGVVQRKKEGK